MTNNIPPPDKKAMAERDLMFRQAVDTESSADTLMRLSRSNDELIRGAVALNQSAPPELLEALLNDKSYHVLNCLRKRGIRTEPVFVKPKRVIGNQLIFRDANTDDAAFILELRTDAAKSKHISQTSPDLQQQIAWLEKYAKDDSQIYFIIQNRNLERIGTVRLYDKKADSFCWGSWIIKDASPNQYAIESALIVYSYAHTMGFDKAHFDVRKGNESVWRFHERFGAVRVGESAEDYFFAISADAIEKSLKKYSKYLPDPIEVHF